jgi:hypothetical protein
MEVFVPSELRVKRSPCVTNKLETGICNAVIDGVVMYHQRRRTV